MALPITCSSIGGAKFLGCSVVDFNSSAGWGAQSSDVTINLVADCAESFSEPTVGAPETFSMGTFTFTGLVQSWNAKAGSDGNPLYSVKLISPHPILEHTQVILDHYEGRVNFYNIINAYGFLESLSRDCPHNEINGTFFGAPAGGFGEAEKTERGIPWKLIKQAVQALAGGAMGARFEEYCAGLAFKGHNGGTVDYILDISSLPDAHDNYRIAGPVVSLSNLIDQVCQDGGLDYYVTLLPSKKRNTYIIKVVTISRTEEPAIGHISNFVNSHDVINKSLGVELRSEVNSALLAGGKIKQYFQCESFGPGAVVGHPIGGFTAMTPFWGWDSEGELITAVLRAPDGKDSILVGNQPCVGGWVVKLDARLINVALNNVLPDFIEVGENELRASLGDYNSFVANILNPKNDAAIAGHGNLAPSALYTYYKDTLKIIDVGTFGDIRSDRSDARGALDGKMSVAHDDFSGDPSNEKPRDGHAVYNWLKSYTSDFYGKQFVAHFALNSVPKLPRICKSEVGVNFVVIGFPRKPGKVIYSDMPSTDGAWASEPKVAGAPHGGFNEAGDILGLANPSLNADRFKDESGKVQAIVKFSGTETTDPHTGNTVKGGLNTDGLNLNDYVVVKGPDVFQHGAAPGGGTLVTNAWDIWIKATIDEKWVEGSPVQNSLRQIRVAGVLGEQQIVCALVKLSAPLIDIKNDVESLAANRPMDVIQPIGPAVNDQIVDAGIARTNVGGQGESVASLGPLLKTDPVSIGVPLQSTTNCYGPWENVGADPGSTLVEVDDGLVPWEYGSLDLMDEAGDAKVEDMATHQQQAERGEITVPGLPRRALAMNINVSNAGGAERIDTIRIAGVAVSFYIYRFNVAQQSSAVISNISTSIGAGGVTTTYTINTFTPVFGRFSKGNAERLKEIGLNKLRNEREGRARTALMNRIRASETRARNLANTVVENMGKEQAPKSPAIWFAGRLDAANTKRKIVLAPTKLTMPYYDEDEAAKTSVMTMDGFFRPVQTVNGTAYDLPKVVGGTDYCGGVVPTQSSGPPPPVNTQSPLAISTKYLDFLADSEKRPALFDDDRTEDSDSDLGHDIEGVARGVQAADMWNGDCPGRLLMHTGVGAQAAHDFMAHYRFMALRGPLMIHGWGYDLNGKPIPNAHDDDAAPIFKTNYLELKDKFKPNWLEDAKTWPVAPVDLRFDRKRGVWTIPSSFRLYQVETSGDIDAGEMGDAVVIKYKEDILKADGDKIDEPKIQIENWTKATIKSGTQALAYYDTAECKYWMIPPASGTSGVINVGATGCGNDIECSGLDTGCLIFGSGLYGAWDGDGSDRGNFTVTGPKIQSGNCAGVGVGEAVSFDRLRFVSGLTAVNDEGCGWKIGGPTIQESGCEGEEDPQALGNLIIGSGITFIDQDNCNIRIEGPKIGGSSGCSGAAPMTSAPFAELTIGNGLGLTSGENCGYTIDNCWETRIGATGCDNDIECSGLETGCLIFGSGLYGTWDGEGRDDKIFTVTGPKIGGSSGCSGAAPMTSAPFAELTIGNGLGLTSGENCGYTVDNCWDTRVGAEGCGNDIECSGLETGCLIFGSGLYGTWDGEGRDDKIFTVTGPKLGGNSGCAGEESITSAPFTELTIGRGLGLIAGEDDCTFTLESCSTMTVGWSGCNVAEPNPYACDTITGCLVFGSGLGTPVKTDETFIVQGAQITSNAESIDHDPDIGGYFDTLTIGSGLKLEGSSCAYTITASGGGGGSCDGLTTGLELVTKVCCSGANFAVYRKTFNFESGCLMSVETPVVSSQHCDEEE